MITGLFSFYLREFFQAFFVGIILRMLFAKIGWKSSFKGFIVSGITFGVLMCLVETYYIFKAGGF